MNNFMQLLSQTDEASNIPEAPPWIQSSYWFPEQASSFASNIDFLFYAIFWVSLFFFVAMVGAMTYFVIKYRARPGHAVEKSPSHNTLLEIAWSVLPSFLLIWFFIEGANGFFKMRVPPGDAEQIHVIARQFNWMFIYPDGDSTTDLHLVRNRPVEFLLESRDVLHSFSIPAFRQKQDIVPGRYIKTWAKPTKSGVYRLYCTEYCGQGHSTMKTNVTVHETEEQRKAATEWLWKDVARTDPAKNGERLFNMQCSGCHNTNNVTKTGPGLGGKWGITETLDNGSSVEFDENYFRESVLEPNAKIVAGFARPSQMPSFQGKLNEDQLFWLMAYVKSLSGIVQEPRPKDLMDEDGNKSGNAEESSSLPSNSSDDPPSGKANEDKSKKDDPQDDKNIES